MRKGAIAPCDVLTMLAGRGERRPQMRGRRTPIAVDVWPPIEYSPEQVGAALGEPALPLPLHDRVVAPFITVDARLYAPTSNFLRHHCQAGPNLATARRIASDLGAWVDYLINQRRLHPH